MCGLLAAAGQARGEDLVTLSGTTYHDVRALRVEPDGVTWRYERGVVKVDFADCPEAVRRAYHYDPDKATTYRDTQAAAHRQAAEQAQKLVHAREEQQRVRMTLQNTSEASPSPGGGTAFALRRQLDSESAAATALDEQAQAKKTARELSIKDNGTIWDSRLWAVPRLIFGSSDGLDFEPGTNLNAREFKASVHHPPGGYPPNCLQDSFYTPAYMTKSYYEDIDRAEAFARGVPLK